MTLTCSKCGKKKPILFGGFIQCNHCNRTFCPECSKKFEYINYPRKIKHIKCPRCKYVGFKSA